MCVHRGSELLREVAWVVFDEVHYMQVRTYVIVLVFGTHNHSAETHCTHVPMSCGWGEVHYMQVRTYVCTA